ncbi:MAG: hypothetical protein PHV48_05370, partial [Candidatus Omnitrophica bacterium]|nr:hypothetical protein [Candidatus Omnitrophota bacterium]
MKDLILQKDIRMRLKKAIAAVLAVAFLFNDAAFAADYQNLAPKAALTLPQFRERFEKGYDVLNHEAVNSYIKAEIDKAGGFENIEKREDRVWINGNLVTILIAAIPDLFMNRGQFAHEGLGKWNNMPVIYADKRLAYFNESRLRLVKKRIGNGIGEEKREIIEHGKNEIAKWILWKTVREDLAFELNWKYEKRDGFRDVFVKGGFRDVWIRGNPGAKEAAYSFHRDSVSLGHLFLKYKDMLNWEELYRAYLGSGVTFDSEDDDVNIAASGVD